MIQKPDHATCESVLRDMMAAQGVEITVSTAAPLVAGPYTTDAHVCPHGVAFWIEPTGEQIAQWVRDGVK
jgi:hypothetical protein